MFIAIKRTWRNTWPPASINSKPDLSVYKWLRNVNIHLPVHVKPHILGHSLSSTPIMFSSLMICGTLTRMRAFSRPLGLMILSVLQQCCVLRLLFAFAILFRHRGFGSSPSRSQTASSASRGPRRWSRRPTRRWRRPITLASCRPPRASTRGQAHSCFWVV